MDSPEKLDSSSASPDAATLEDASEHYIDKLQAEDLSAADRRLAELGYTQVSSKVKQALYQK